MPIALLLRTVLYDKQIQGLILVPITAHCLSLCVGLCATLDRRPSKMQLSPLHRLDGRDDVTQSHSGQGLELCSLQLWAGVWPLAQPSFRPTALRVLERGANHSRWLQHRWESHLTRICSGPTIASLNKTPCPLRWIPGRASHPLKCEQALGRGEEYLLLKSLPKNGRFPC